MKRNNRQRGQATLEFMLSAIVLFTMFFWAIQLILFIYTYVVIADAAKEGVRYAVVHGSGNSNSTCTYNSGSSTWDCSSVVSAVQTWVQNYANYPGMTINVSYPDTSTSASIAPNKPLSRVQVTISYPYTPLLSVFTSQTVHASAMGTINY